MPVNIFYGLSIAAFQQQLPSNTVDEHQYIFIITNNVPFFNLLPHIYLLSCPSNDKQRSNHYLSSRIIQFYLNRRKTVKMMKSTFPQPEYCNSSKKKS